MHIVIYSPRFSIIFFLYYVCVCVCACASVHVCGCSNNAIMMHLQHCWWYIFTRYLYSFHQSSCVSEKCLGALLEHTSTLTPQCFQNNKGPLPCWKNAKWSGMLNDIQSGVPWWTNKFEVDYNLRGQCISWCLSPQAPWHK